MWYAILSGLGIGLIGSFHCIGMCGPIAFSLPLYGRPLLQKLFLSVCYNLGRSSGYALIGILCGLVGRQFFLSGYQQLFSVSVGILILTLFLAERYVPAKARKPLYLFHNLKRHIALQLASADKGGSFFTVGLLNSLLPCGLVYVAAGAAMTLGNAWYGAALMFLFGLGTFPLMMTAMLGSTAISLSMRMQIRRLMPAFVCCTALLMIVRGMNLGIPYLSPQIQKAPTNEVRCHR
jgi:uncharacterized protein